MPFSKAILEKTASESVYDRLLDYVFSDQVQPGEKLVERDLAKKFQVSRVPIREALTKMVAQGLLVGGANRQGVRVRQYTPAENRQLVEFRFFLECCAMEAAAQKVETDDLSSLEKICDQAETVDIENDQAAFGNLDHQFHVEIAKTSRNDRVIHLLEGLLTECHFVFYIHPSVPLSLAGEDRLAKQKRTVDEHRKIVEAIGKKDGTLATEILRRHLHLDLLS